MTEQLVAPPLVRPAWIEIDRSAIAHNARQMAALVEPAVLCAVVKADGYAHGAAVAAVAAIEGGAGWLAVALVEEGQAIRDRGVSAPILVLSEPPLDGFDGLVAAGLQPTLYTHDGIAAARAAAAASGSVVDVHLKVNTGMNRVGARPTDALALAREIDAAAELRLAGVWTHLACADEADLSVTAGQMALFRDAVGELVAAGIEVPLLHVANSAGAIASPETRLDMVRSGIVLYGVPPAPRLGDRLDLRPAMRLVARVSFVKRVAAGERVSYGLRHRFERDTTVATVPVGYADGVPRRLGLTGGQVLIGGRRRAIVGVVTMDQLMVDCGDDDVAVGDEVVLLGIQGDERVDAWEWAERLDTIGYEIICGFGPRLPRVIVG